MTGPGRAERTRLRSGAPRPTSRLGRAVARVSDDPRARAIREVLDEYSEIAGDLLAFALALRALVGFLLLVLLLAALLGYLTDDPSFRASVLSRVAEALPGLELPVQDTLRGLSAGRTLLSILGLLGLFWSAGGIYGSLDDAMRRVFPGGPQRNLVVRWILGLVAVVLVLGSVAAMLVLGAAWSAIEGNVVAPGDVVLWRLVGPLGSAAIASLAVLAIFRLVPTAPPSVRDALPPSIAAGVAIALMTAAYALVAPRLVGALAVFGAIAAVIGTLLWLAWLFRVVLVAGVWAARRRDASKPEPAPAST